MSDDPAGHSVRLQVNHQRASISLRSLLKLRATGLWLGSHDGRVASEFDIPRTDNIGLCGRSSSEVQNGLMGK